MIVIGVIDNYPLFQQGLAFVLHNHFKNKVKISWARNISEFKPLYFSGQNNLIITDINPGRKEQYLQAVRQLRESIPEIPLIIYDEDFHSDMAIPYLRLGINGYVLKQSNISESIKCVETVLSGKQYLCPVLFEPFLNSFSPMFEDAPLIQAEK